MDVSVEANIAQNQIFTCFSVQNGGDLINAIIALLVSFIKDILNKLKLALLTKKLENQKKETTKEVKNAEKAYTDFMDEYNTHLRERRLRNAAGPVRDGSTDPEDSN